MHPRPDWMFNQVGDDRDHHGMRIPKEDSVYGKGNERPVYFLTGERQQRGKFLNNTTGTTSTAAKFSSAFALASLLRQTDSNFRRCTGDQEYYKKSFSAFRYAMKKKGATQTASVMAPYIYEEDNWCDDLELSTAMLNQLDKLRDTNKKGSRDHWRSA